MRVRKQCFGKDDEELCIKKTVKKQENSFKERKKAQRGWWDEIEYSKRVR